MSDHEHNNFGAGPTPSYIQKMLDNAIPIWHVLGLSEELYMEKYVKPFIHKVCDVVEEICEEMIEVVHAVEEVVGVNAQAEEVVEVAEMVLKIAEIVEEVVTDDAAIETV